MYRKQSYGIGGALLKIGSNLAQGKGFGSGALQGVGKAAITPGSGIGAGAELAGGLLQKSNNPLAQKIGKGLDVASNFAPGGGGIAGAVGDVAGLAGGAGGAGAAGAAGAAAPGGGGIAGAVGNLAQNFLGQAHGGGIPHNPEIAGAPYKMRGVRLMKSGGAMFPQGVISAQGGTKNPDLTGTIPASDFRLHLSNGEREFYRVNPEGGFSYVGPQSEVMKLIDPDQKVEFFRDVLGYEQTGEGKYFPIDSDILKARALQEQQNIAFGEELRRDPAYRSDITREATKFAKMGAPLDMTPSEQAFAFVLHRLRDQASEGAGKQFAGGRAPI